MEKIPKIKYIFLDQLALRYIAFYLAGVLIPVSSISLSLSFFFLDRSLFKISIFPEEACSTYSTRCLKNPDMVNCVTLSKYTINDKKLLVFPISTRSINVFSVESFQSYHIGQRTKLRIRRRQKKKKKK